MSGKKRKAEGDTPDSEDRMSASPTSSPSMSTRTLATPSSNRHTASSKRLRTNLTGRPLPLPRLLETLDPDQLRSVIQSICDRNPSIGQEVTAQAPKPSIQTTLSVLNNYENALSGAFPFGGRTSSDYSYNRVRPSLLSLLSALQDFTPHFLPPHESQPATSLTYLDAATNIIHRLPDWDTYQNNRHKQEAYEEIGRAWALVLREAAKRGGGIQLKFEGWDGKVRRHNEVSGGRMQEAVQELQNILGGFFDGGNGGSGGSAGGENETAGASGAANDDLATLRQQMASGTYGSDMGVRVGPW